MYRIRLRCKFFLLQHNFGPAQKYPDVFESATFSFRIRLPPTRIRPVSPAYESETFLPALQNENFGIRYVSGKTQLDSTTNLVVFLFQVEKIFSSLWNLACSFLSTFASIWWARDKSRDSLSPCNGQNVSTKMGNTYSKCICLILSFFYGSLQERVAC